MDLQNATKIALHRPKSNSNAHRQISPNDQATISILKIRKGFIAFLFLISKTSSNIICILLVDLPLPKKVYFSSFLNLTEKHKISLVLPLHPRTLKMKEALLDKVIQEKLDQSPYIKIIPPVSFLDMIALEKKSTLIITDSGGVQKEAYFFQKPCVILRPQTEWVEIIRAKCATIVDTDQDKILYARR